ncbi:MAG TPA: CHAD domain-containing protein [Bradyrhizobium sp.]|nr:CHAD domain-containing protein [Bradyrhizobium sp.]
MTCKTAFRTIAGHYLKELTVQHRATCAGNADALHDMRIALTRLRTSIAFFLPMVAGPQQRRLAEELKWLNAHLGAVRDLDVAIEWLMKVKTKRQQADHQRWMQERVESQRHLTRALRSARFKRLITSISRWIEKGAWSTKHGIKAAGRRTRSLGEHSARQLPRWQKKLIKKSRKLKDIDAKKRHRLRLLNKNLGYAIEAVTNLIPAAEIPNQQATLKVLRKAQRSLGQLNDDQRCQSLAASLGQSKAVAAELLLGPKREKRLLRAAASAYEKLAKLKSLRV